MRTLESRLAFTWHHNPATTHGGCSRARWKLETAHAAILPQLPGLIGRARGRGGWSRRGTLRRLADAIQEALQAPWWLDCGHGEVYIPPRALVHTRRLLAAVQALRQALASVSLAVAAWRHAIDSWRVRREVPERPTSVPTALRNLLTAFGPRPAT